MGRRDKINSLIKEEVNDYLTSLEENQPRVDLMRIPFGSEEIIEAVDSLLSTQVTMGDKVRIFEKQWSDYLNVRFSTMVNSGSSANLLALSVLRSKQLQNRIKKNTNIITPALTWSTTVFPIINVNCVPKLIDVNLDDFVIDIDAINEAIDENTSAIMPVHLLGKPADMKAIMELADDHDLWVIEDSCEAHGARIGNQKIGSFGHISTFSFFFSHHITTMEGGMVSTNSKELNNLMNSYRAHGWVRERSDKNQLSEKHSNIDPRFLFVSLGYNLRPTDLQGAFGMHQIKKLDGFLKKRSAIAEYWNQELSKFDNFFLLNREKDGYTNAWFGYPLIIREGAPFSRKEFSEYLEGHRIQTRPIMGGNIARHPVFDYEKVEIHGELSNANYIMDNGIFVGNHQDLREIDQEHLVTTISQFIAKFI